MLKLADILAAKDFSTVEVAVPQWGGAVLLRPMSGKARDYFEQTALAAQKSGKPLDNFRARYIAACLCDESGALLVVSEKDIAALGEKSGSVLDVVYARARSLNGHTEEEIKALEGN